MKICHISSVHPSDDTRIFVKECSSIAKYGYETFLVAKGESREENHVHVIGVGTPHGSRFHRMVAFSKKVYKTALALDCDVYHLHDPELLPFALKLKKRGKIIIFDSHEDIPAQVMSKEWIPYLFRKAIAWMLAAYIRYVGKRIDGFVAATPYIGEQLKIINENTEVICNYPVIKHVKNPICYSERSLELGYTGICVTRDRGAIEMVEAARKTNTRLDIFGRIDDVDLKEELAQRDVGGKLHIRGLLPYETLQKQMAQIKIGFLVEHPTPNAYNALCIKMFEYMLHGIPIICSNIPLWASIINEASCGICVDPFDVEAITKSIVYLQEHQEEAAQMGLNGFRLVCKKYRWDYEEKKLIEMYKRQLMRGERKCLIKY